MQQRVNKAIEVIADDVNGATRINQIILIVSDDCLKFFNIRIEYFL